MFRVIPNYLENPVKHPHFDFFFISLRLEFQRMASRIDAEIDIRNPQGLNARLLVITKIEFLENL